MMRVRENRRTINASLTTVVTVEGRAELFRYVMAMLRLKGVYVTEEMIHVDHRGYNERTDWDEYAVIVDRYGVFGFTDQPCPDDSWRVEWPQQWPPEQIHAAEIETSFDVPCAPKSICR